MRNSFILVLVCLALAACQTTGARTINKLQTKNDQTRIVVMPVDVELSELRASGAAIVQAEWTKTASGLISTSLDKFLDGRQARTINFQPSAEDEKRSSARAQLQKLHVAVGATVIRHHLFQQLQLPSKKGNFDWTLGKKVKVLRDRNGSDYALFIYIRDSYTTAGRALVMFLAAGLGAAVQGGTQTGFASLVDTTTGELVWFNVLSRGTGDLRGTDGADDTIKALLKDFPA